MGEAAPGAPGRTPPAIGDQPAALAALMARALRAPSEDAVYQVIADWAAEHLSALRFSVALLTEDGEHLQIRSLQGSQGLAPAGVTMPVAGTSLGRVVTTGMGRVWHPQADAPGTEGPLLAGQGIGEVANVPLRANGQVVGTLNLARPVGVPILGADYEQLTEIAGIISTNLERFRMLSLTRQALARERAQSQLLAAVARLGVALSATTDRRHIVDALADGIQHVLPADRISLGVPGGPEQEAMLVATAELSQDAGALPDLARRAEGRMAGAVLRTGEPCFLDDLSASEYPEHRDLAEAGLRTATALPIRVGGEVVAVLIAVSRRRLQVDADLANALRLLTALVGACLERIDAQAEAERQLHRTHALIDDCPLLLLTLFGDGTIARSSVYGARQIGHRAETLRGRSILELYPDRARDEVALALTGLIGSRPGATATWQAELVDHAGQARWIRHSARRMAAADGEPEILMVCEDISEVLALSERLHHEATHDALTGLINRRELVRRLEALIAAGGTLSLCVIDVDHFKRINDTHGHAAGDEALVALAEVLRRSIGPEDLLCRYGGDELVLVLPDRSLDDAVRVAERLRREAEQLVLPASAGRERLSLSIGVACLDRSADLGALMRDADTACYAAKAAGRNRVAVSHPVAAL